jgi:hypothetical protein
MPAAHRPREAGEGYRRASHALWYLPSSIEAEKAAKGRAMATKESVE